MSKHRNSSSHRHTPPPAAPPAPAAVEAAEANTELVLPEAPAEPAPAAASEPEAPPPAVEPSEPAVVADSEGTSTEVVAPLTEELEVLEEVTAEPPGELVLETDGALPPEPVLAVEPPVIAPPTPPDVPLMTEEQKTAADQHAAERAKHLAEEEAAEFEEAAKDPEWLRWIVENPTALSPDLVRRAKERLAALGPPVANPEARGHGDVDPEYRPIDPIRAPTPEELAEIEKTKAVYAFRREVSDLAEKDPVFAAKLDLLQEKHERAFYEDVRLIVAGMSPTQQQIIKPAKRYRVKKDVKVALGGSIVTLKAGTVVDEARYGPKGMSALLTEPRVELEEV